jgi:carbon-monoxide dehydrogenase medium subunit
VTLPNFDYIAPRTLDEALSLLAKYGDLARPIAGGQSLMPVLAFRLATPDLLVDLNRIEGLRYINIGADGVVLGALARWLDIETETRLVEAHPLLVEAVRHVAHYQIRNRGTIGGSLAHADPAAELPGIAVACDAELTLASTSSIRTVRASDFFLGGLSTQLNDAELIVSLRFPAWPGTRRWGFREFARRQGDFALSGIALHFDQAADGRVMAAHVGAFGAVSSPSRLTAAEEALNGRRLDATTIPAIGADVAAAVRAAVDPPDDMHGSARYRRAVTGTLAGRALHDAMSRHASC